MLAQVLPNLNILEKMGYVWREPVEYQCANLQKNVFQTCR